jgi:glycosyltransferase involved in cell wall biosynthesis
MRIVELTDSYYPCLGGLERVVEELSDGLAALGHSVTVVTGEIPGTPQREQRGAVRIERLPMLSTRIPGLLKDAARPFHATAPDPLFSKGLRDVLRRVSPDVVHSHGWSMYSALHVCRALEIPVVQTAHDYGLVCACKTRQRAGRGEARDCDLPEMRLQDCLPCAWRQYGPRAPLVVGGLRMFSRAHRQLASAVAVSDAVRDAGLAPLRRHAPARQVTLPAFVADATIDQAGRPVPRPPFVPAGPYVMFVGALQPVKGVEDAVTAVQQVRARGLDLQLVLAGEGPLEGFGAAPWVRYVGVRSPSEVLAGYQHASSAIVPSRWQEPWGKVAVEAQASGCPALVTSVGGLKDLVVDGVTGIVVPPRRPDLLATALARLIGDPEHRRVMVAAARAHAREYALSTVIDSIVVTLEAAAGRR